MKNNVGIFNSQSNINEYMHGLRMAVVKSPAMFTITSYAERIAGRYEAALMLIKGGLTAKGERLAQEYETQLTLLAEFADEEAGILLAARRAAFVEPLKTTDPVCTRDLSR